MTAERWRDRVRKARRELDEARRWQRQVDDAAAEQRVEGARDNLRRAALNKPPIPESAREALRRFDEFVEDNDERLQAGDPALEDQMMELMAAATDAECAAGVHTHCRHHHQWRKPSDSPLRDDDEVSGDWFAEQRAKTWGVIQPDGTVVARGFLGDPEAQEDMAVHPPGVIAVHGANGWTNAATGHPASEGPARRPDADPPPEPEKAMSAPAGYVDIKPTDDPETRRVKQAHNLAVNLDWTATTESERREAAAARRRADDLQATHEGRRRQDDTRQSEERQAAEAHREAAAKPHAPAVSRKHTHTRLEMQRRGRWYDTDPITSTNTAPTGGTGMSIGDAKQDMLGPIEKLNEALGLVQAGHAALEEAQTGLQHATAGSNQAEADAAHAQVAESLSKVDEAMQQIAQALPEFEGVAKRL